MALIGPGVVGNNSQFPVANRTFPSKGGPRCLPILLQFTGALTVIPVDLTQQVQNGVIDSVQNIYIDNSTNAAQLQIVTGVPGQIIKCPAYSEGYFSVLASNPPQFVFSSTGAVNVQAIFLNIDMGNHVWSVNNTSGGTVTVSDPVLDATVLGNNVTVRGAIGAPTSRTINGTTVATSSSLVAANPSRRSLEFQAPNAGVGIWYNPLGGACAPNGVDCFFLPPGMKYENPPNFVPNTAFTYYDPQGGLVLPCMEG